MPRGVWKAVETKVGKVGIVEAEGKGEKTKSRKKTRREGSEEKEENNGSKESDKRMKNMG